MVLYGENFGLYSPASLIVVNGNLEIADISEYNDSVIVVRITVFFYCSVDSR